MATRSVQCGDCGQPLCETPECAPCPQCGSRKQQVNIGASDAVTVECQELVKDLKQRRQGIRRPVKEIRAGESLFKATGDYNQIRRVIDRENGWYEEHIVSPTGEVLRSVSHPLSEHSGRGSAKFKPRATRSSRC